VAGPEGLLLLMSAILSAQQRAPAGRIEGGVVRAGTGEPHIAVGFFPLIFYTLDQCAKRSKTF
jgi:hypothetical protein